MFLVLGKIVRVDEDIVQINSNTNIKKILENIIHEALESGGSVGKAEGHDKPFKGAIAGPEGSLPFVSSGDPDKVVGVTEINLGVDTSFTGRVEKVGNEREWIAILFGDPIQTSEIDAEAERPILLFDK